MASQARTLLRIKDVAEQAGVSPATVSRVLNANDTVSESTRQKVAAVIEALGYRPNRVASNLRRRQAQMIGVVVSDIENPHFTAVIRAVEDAAYRKGYRVVLCNTDEQPEKQSAYLGVLAAERVAGAIISPSEPKAPEISELIDNGTCVVAFDRDVADHRADAVLVANKKGARWGTEHLLSCGHRSIGYISGPLGVQTASERLQGYRVAMTTARVAPLVAHGNFRIDGGAAAARQLLAAGATALLVGNNLMAVGALRTVKDVGLRVGRDVAIVSVDDPPWAELTDPPMTTLAQPVRAMASAAVEMLLSRLEGGRQHRRRQVFDFEWRHRHSCCPGAESG